jgi:hypothetical protein
MQRRDNHASIRIKELLGNNVFCWVRPEAIKREELRKSLEAAVDDNGEEKT